LESIADANDWLSSSNEGVKLFTKGKTHSVAHQATTAKVVSEGEPAGNRKNLEFLKGTFPGNEVVYVDAL
jgi:hypothetical protein